MGSSLRQTLTLRLRYKCSGCMETMQPYFVALYFKGSKSNRAVTMWTNVAPTIIIMLLHYTVVML